MSRFNRAKSYPGMKSTVLILIFRVQPCVKKECKKAICSNLTL
jgi:hypothetical protein